MQNKNEIVIKKGMSNDEIRQLIDWSTEKNFLTVELWELNKDQAEIISMFRWWRIDLSKLIEINNINLQILSNYNWDKLEISWLNNVNKTTVSLLNSFGRSENDKFVLIIKFNIWQNYDTDKYVSNIMNLDGVNLWSIWYIKVICNQERESEIKRNLPKTKNRVVFNS